MRRDASFRASWLYRLACRRREVRAVHATRVPRWWRQAWWCEEWVVVVVAWEVEGQSRVLAAQADDGAWVVVVVGVRVDAWVVGHVWMAQENVVVVAGEVRWWAAHLLRESWGLQKSFPIQRDDS